MWCPSVALLMCTTRRRMCKQNRPQILQKFAPTKCNFENFGECKYFKMFKLRQNGQQGTCKCVIMNSLCLKEANMTLTQRTRLKFWFFLLLSLCEILWRALLQIQFVLFCRGLLMEDDSSNKIIKVWKLPWRKQCWVECYSIVKTWISFWVFYGI